MVLRCLLAASDRERHGPIRERPFRCPCAVICSEVVPNCGGFLPLGHEPDIRGKQFFHLEQASHYSKMLLISYQKMTRNLRRDG